MKVASLLVHSVTETGECHFMFDYLQKVEIEKKDIFKNALHNVRNMSMNLNLFFKTQRLNKCTIVLKN